MLVLTRKAGEAVDAYDTRNEVPVITVTVLGILPGGVVRLGFDAEQHIRITRDNIKSHKEREDGDNEEPASGNR